MCWLMNETFTYLQAEENIGIRKCGKWSRVRGDAVSMMRVKRGTPWIGLRNTKNIISHLSSQREPPSWWARSRLQHARTHTHRDEFIVAHTHTATIALKYYKVRGHLYGNEEIKSKRLINLLTDSFPSQLKNINYGSAIGGTNQFAVNVFNVAQRFTRCFTTTFILRW